MYLLRDAGEIYFIPRPVAVDVYVSWKPIRRFNKPSVAAAESSELRRGSREIERYTRWRLREFDEEETVVAGQWWRNR